MDDSTESNREHEYWHEYGAKAIAEIQKLSREVDAESIVRDAIRKVALQERLLNSAFELIMQYARWHTYYEQHRKPLIDWAKKDYPKANVELAVDEVLQKSAPINKKKVDFGYLRNGVRNHCLNQLTRRLNKEKELGDFDRIAGLGAPNLQGDLYRRRQGQTLSDILREFVAFCEANPSRYSRKSVCEGHLLGMSNDEIADVLSLSVQQVYDRKKRYVKWLRERIQSNDVNRSVFISFMQAPLDSPDAPDIQGRPSPKHPQSLEDSLSQPPCKDLGDVLSWIVWDTDALCPSRERSTQFLSASPDKQKSEFPDVYFHMILRAEKLPVCRICCPEAYKSDTADEQLSTNDSKRHRD